MNGLDEMISFLGWASLTYLWLHTNFIFVDATFQAIKNHNTSIRDQVYSEAYNKGYIQAIDDEKEEEEES